MGTISVWDQKLQNEKKRLLTGNLKNNCLTQIKL